MMSIDDHFYSIKDTIQTGDMHMFIKEARSFFENNVSAESYTSTHDMMIRTKKPPYNRVGVLADRYEEIGLWLPTQSTVHKGVALIWDAPLEGTPTQFQRLYIKDDGHLEIHRTKYNYSTVSGMTVTGFQIMVNTKRF